MASRQKMPTEGLVVPENLGARLPIVPFRRGLPPPSHPCLTSTPNPDSTSSLLATFPVFHDPGSWWRPTMHVTLGTVTESTRT